MRIQQLPATTAIEAPVNENRCRALFPSCLPVLITRLSLIRQHLLPFNPSPLSAYEGAAAGAPVPVPCPGRLACGGRKSGIYA